MDHILRWGPAIAACLFTLESDGTRAVQICKMPGSGVGQKLNYRAWWSLRSIFCHYNGAIITQVVISLGRHQPRMELGAMDNHPRWEKHLKAAISLPCSLRYPCNYWHVCPWGDTAEHPLCSCDKARRTGSSWPIMCFHQLVHTTYGIVLISTRSLPLSYPHSSHSNDEIKFYLERETKLFSKA